MRTGGLVIFWLIMVINLGVSVIIEDPAYGMTAVLGILYFADRIGQEEREEK